MYASYEFLPNDQLALQNVSPENILGDAEVYHKIIWQRYHR